MVQNASDYLAHLKSAKVEERMQTTAFIVYKDKFTQYLQTFVIGLQRSAQKMEKLFQQSTPELEESLFGRLAERQLAIAVMEEERTQQDYLEDFRESFQIMREWFMGTGYRDSELSALSRETVDTIRRITKFAQRLAEQHQSFRSRKAEYLHLALWFSQLDSKEEADELSAIVFGPDGGRHFYAESREMEDYTSRIEEEPATELELAPRVRTYRERLPVLSREARQMLLGWVARALHRNPVSTEMGFGVELLYDPKEKRRICIHCEDGDFAMPPMKFRLQRSK